MKGDEWLEEKFEKELQILRDFLPTEPDELEKAEEDGPMSWEKAMERPLLYGIELDVGGDIEIKINHNQGYQRKTIQK